MHRSIAFAVFCTFVGGSLLLGQDDAKLKSGPPPGTVLAGPFEALNVSGPAKGRYHCLVCRFGLNPSVLVFARTPGKDEEGLKVLLEKLDAAAEKFQAKKFGAAVVYLSPEASSSVNNPAETDVDKLAKEAAAREALVAQLGGKADKLKHVIVACYPPEGPKGYNLDPKADVTVLFFRKLKVIDNFTFGPGQLNDQAADAVVQKVQDGLAGKKAAEPKKGE